MAGSTQSTFNGIVDNIMTALSSATTLGSPTGVYERDEHPAIPANEGALPILYVVPLVEGKHSISMTMDVGAAHHSFPVSIVGFYEMPDVATSLRTVRGYADNALYVQNDGGSSTAVQSTAGNFNKFRYSTDDPITDTLNGTPRTGTATRFKCMPMSVPY